MANQFLSHLRKEHREVTSILDQLKEGDGKKGELFSKLKTQLVPHLKAEEKVFYPLLMEKKDARDETLEAFEEHHITQVLFTELEKMADTDERWDAKLKVLKELVDHHVKEEERNIFKLAEQQLPKDQFPAILENFEKEKQNIAKRLS